MLELPTNRLQSSHQPSQQLLLHKVPIRFPVPSNLMESIETLIFINNVLISLIGDLPSDALIDATPLNRVDSHQARTAVALTFDTELTRNWVLRVIRERRANNAIPREVNFYFTEMPRRSRALRQTHTEDELQAMRNEAMESREERPKGKAKKSSKDKPKALQTPEPADSNLQVEIENDLYESPEPEGYGPESTHQNETKIRSCGSKKLETQ